MSSKAYLSVLAGAALVAGGGFLVLKRGVGAQFIATRVTPAFRRLSRQSSPNVGPNCDRGLANLRLRAVTGENPHASGPGNNQRRSPSPAGMVFIPGGEFWMGSAEANFKDAQPWHRVKLSGFWIDTTEVTNEEFGRFVEATGYITLAERIPNRKDFPNAPLENLVAGSVVFTPPTSPVSLGNHYQWWSYVKGASWRHPDGPNSTIRGLEKHPVVHVAYEDAVAYAQWAGKRLPTEAEFEYAERGGLDRKRFAWGDEFQPNGKFMANTFQGHFPDRNTGEDGYLTTAPVASFPPNGFGLYDMSGNVWEWTSDWYRADSYVALAGKLTVNPNGPSDSFDPAEPGVAKRVQRGGSFLCADEYCARYIVGGRGKGDPDTGTNHLGFRCVLDSK